MEERIEEIDWEENIIKTHPKDKLKETMFPHKASVVIPKTKDGKIILCKRAKDKHPFPGTWCCGVGGKVAAGESEEIAALREMKEEVGINSALDFVTKVKYDKEDYKALFYVFTTKENFTVESFSIDPREIEYLKEFEVNEVTKMINENQNKFAPTFITLFKEFAKEWRK